MNNLENKSVVELKAMAYDLLAKQQQLNQFLITVNNAITMKESKNRQEEAKKTEKKLSKDK